MSFGNGAVGTRSCSAARGWLMRVKVAKASGVLLDTRLSRAASGLITWSDTELSYRKFDFTCDYVRRLPSSTNFGGRPEHTWAFAYCRAGSMRREAGIGDHLSPDPTLIPTAGAPAATHPHAHAPNRIEVDGSTTTIFTCDANGTTTTGLGGLPA